MPPRKFSRHEFTEELTNDDGKRYLSERVPYRYYPHEDNVTRTVGQGDSLFTLAGSVYAGLTDRPAGLWWVLADFQIDPIIDPTLRLEIGRVIVCPSQRTVQEEIFSSDRRLVT